MRRGYPETQVKKNELIPHFGDVDTKFIVISNKGMLAPKFP